MKNCFRKALSLIISATMAFSMLAGGIVSANDGAVTTTVKSVEADAAKVDVSTIARFIVDMRSTAAFEKTNNVYAHKPSEAEPDPWTGGKYAFNDELKAMEVQYSASDVQRDWRMMLRFNQPNKLEDLNYMVVVYRVDTKGEYNFHLWNSPKQGKEIVIAAKGADTKGQFVISEPFDITAENNGSTIKSRWNSTSKMNTFGIDSTDTDLKLYIKEVGFFKTAEDAKAYYANVDINTAPPAYDEEAASYAALPDPVAIVFEGGLAMNAKGTGFFTNSTDAAASNFDSVTVNGVKAVKLNYAKHDSWDAYRIMPKFMNANVVTAEHKYVRVVYMTTDTQAHELKIKSNSGGGEVVVASNTAASRGEWIVSDAVIIEGAGTIQQRWIEGKHNTILYTSTDPNSNIYIKEIVFFSSLKQASEYYGDTSVTYQEMTFGSAGNSAFTNGDTYGVHSVNTADSTLDITYAASTNMAGVNYMAKIKFADKYLTDANRYVRILYSAELPGNQSGVGLYLRNDNGGDTATFTSNLKDTDGKFVLSETTEFPIGLMGRLSGTTTSSGKPMHASLCMTSTDPASLLRVKAIYFFPEKSAADSFEVSDKVSKVTINGADISSYRIVISEEAGSQTMLAAELLSNLMKNLTGVDLAIVTDAEAPTANEILVGVTNRALSDELFNEVSAKDSNAYSTKIEGTTLAIAATLPYNLNEAVEDYMRNHLYLGIDAPEVIALTEANAHSSLANNMVPFTLWEKPVNVSDPEVYTDDFDADDGYWQEEGNTSNWKFEGGVYTVDAKEKELSYIHVYETNVKFSAKLRFSNAASDANIALMLRYTAADAYLRAGYDFEAGEWYIDTREGNDFNRLRVASAKATVDPNTWYNLVFTADGTTATLYVDGTPVLSADNVTQRTMGRVAVYAEGAKLDVDDAEITLLSGQGTILKNITHLKIDNKKYTEGGSAIVLNDGTVHFEHQNIAMQSKDNGYTWEQVDKRLSVTGYPNILRLNNGELLRANVRKGGYQIASISTDDGLTWTDVGKICADHWQGTTAGAGNMNDKLTQSATTGRIFYGMNYESPTVLDNGRRVFCEFYYSDDNGRTWTKSETDSWELEGNEDTQLFGEAKLIECADGTIRMYASWTAYGCLVYADSHDNGKTFGPLQKMEGFQCARSSVQFVRDPYVENKTTYYMVWVNSPMFEKELNSSMSRAAITLAKSTDGKNWSIIGDIWRWHSHWLAPGSTNLINHVVDPFVQVTEDTVIVGSGISEQIRLKASGDFITHHQAQREHLWALDKKANDPGENLGSFLDVTTKDTYYDAVKFVTEKGLFNGTSAVTFSPDTNMTRSMFVTVLGRLDGADVAKYTTPTFADVAAGQWYTSYVEWAAANSIVNGIGGGLYGINDNVTVEQVCVMLSRYNGAKTATASGKTLADFADSASVSSWATDAVKWAVENGVYAGTAGKLNPTAPASRALVATMFYNYVSVFAK